MAVITQNYDIDLKATGAFPVVKCSQFDTGSRKIIFTVYDGWELAKIDGCLARVDGTRSDGVEFSRSCSVGEGSKVSFTITQEMTKSAGKHAAELVIFDASGNPIGTQNFMIEVEAATMVRDSAASADDRTLYDQYTSSIDAKFNEISKTIGDKASELVKTAEDINALVGASSEPITIFNGSVGLTSTQDVDKLVVTYDPITGLVHAWATGDVSIENQSDKTDFVLCEIPAKYCPDADYFDGQNIYYVFVDNMREIMAGNTDNNWVSFYLSKKSDDACNLCFRLAQPISQHEAVYQISLNATWYARGGKYIGVSQIGTGGNTVTVGTTTTGEPGTQASVVNSGTAKDVVLDFTIPRGADGSGSSYTLPVATASTLGGVKIGSGISVTSDGTISAAGGDNNHAGTGTNSIALGVGARAASEDSIAIGHSAQSTSVNGGNITIGYNAQCVQGSGDWYSLAADAIAIGNSSKCDDASCIAMGSGAYAGGNSISHGKRIAIGSQAKCTSYNSVVLGANSTDGGEDTVSVGSSYEQRRIVNVGTPTAGTDAATKAYVDALETKLTALEARVAALEAK